MPYVWIPSSNLGSNRPSSSYAHQTHGTLGVLAKGTDPRNRGRRRSRSEIEAASRADRLAREEHLEKMRERAAARAAAEAEKKDARRNAALQRQAEASKRAIALNPEAARLEAARQQTRDEELARKADWASRGGKAERLSPQQQAAAMEQRRRTEAANQVRYGREATAATPVSAQFLMGPERVSSVLSGAPIRNILDQPIPKPVAPKLPAPAPQVQSSAGMAPMPADGGPEGLLEFAMNPKGRRTPNPRDRMRFDMQEMAYREHPEIREPVREQLKSLQLSALPYTFPVGLAQWYGNQAFGD